MNIMIILDAIKVTKIHASNRSFPPNAPREQLPMPPCCPPVLYLLLLLWQGFFDVLRCHSRHKGSSCLQEQVPLLWETWWPQRHFCGAGTLSWFRWVAGCSHSLTQEADDSLVHSEGMEGRQPRMKKQVGGGIDCPNSKERGDTSLWDIVFHWKEHSIDCPIPCWAFSADNKEIDGGKGNISLPLGMRAEYVMWVPRNFPPWFCLSGRKWMFKQMPTTPDSAREHGVISTEERAFL